jgi:ligand-binding SRPBCC domain-containing protein
MRTYRLQTQLWLPQPREEIFNFFSDPSNLDRLTPPWLHFEVLTPKSVEMNAGTLLDYRLRLHGIRLRWQSEISVWEPPNRFIDRQTKGPYRQWVHEHNFSAHQGGTLVGDSVTYSVPGGRIIQKLLVAPDLDRVYGYRHKILKELFNPQQAKTAQSSPVQTI